MTSLGAPLRWHFTDMRGEHRPKRCRRSGFSFIEVLFAIFLVGVGASIVTATLPIANTSRAKADYQNKSVGLAQKELESIRGLGYANVSGTQLFANGLLDSSTPISGTTYAFTNSDTGALDNPARILPNGTGTVSISQADIDLRQVTVTVTWRERNKTRSFTVGTLVANL